MTHICVNKLTIIDLDNGLSYGRRQAIVWTNDGISTIGPLETNFSENLIGIQTISFNKMRLKMSSAKWRPFCLGLNVLIKHLTKTKRNKTDNNKTKQNKRNYQSVYIFYGIHCLSESDGFSADFPNFLGDKTVVLVFRNATNNIWSRFYDPWYFPLIKS